MSLLSTKLSWRDETSVHTTSTMAAVNCKTTNAGMSLLRRISKPLLPLNIFTGKKRETTKAGYAPDAIPSINTVPTIANPKPVVHRYFKAASGYSICCKKGRKAKINPTERPNARAVISTDSFKNWKTMDCWEAPMVLRTAISRPRRPAMIVDRLE